MINYLRQWIIDLLGFSKSEANGTLILILMILSVSILPRIYLLQLKTEPESFEKDKKDLTDWMREIESNLVEAQTTSQHDPERPVAQSFPFNPNQVSYNQLIDLGFNERVARSLINYRNKGGVFKVKSDIRKIYGISFTRVTDLWDKILLPEQINSEKPKSLITDLKAHEASSRISKSIDLNQADTTQLRTIRGIGRVLSNRIIKYRNSLGGFHSPSQLYEVYGMDSLVIQRLLDRSILNQVVKKIQINSDSVHHLVKHPYLDYKRARAIFNYRLTHGKFDSVLQIREIKIIDDSLYQKIYPYLSL